MSIALTKNFIFFLGGEADLWLGACPPLTPLQPPLPQSKREETNAGRVVSAAYPGESRPSRITLEKAGQIDRHHYVSQYRVLNWKRAPK